MVLKPLFSAESGIHSWMRSLKEFIEKRVEVKLLMLWMREPIPAEECRHPFGAMIVSDAARGQGEILVPVRYAGAAAIDKTCDLNLTARFISVKNDIWQAVVAVRKDEVLFAGC